MEIHLVKYGKVEFLVSSKGEASEKLGVYLQAQEYRAPDTQEDGGMQ